MLRLRTVTGVGSVFASQLIAQRASNCEGSFGEKSTPESPPPPPISIEILNVPHIRSYRPSADVKFENKRASGTKYANIMSVQDCVLADIVRKPSGATTTKAYVRAGPRDTTFFDPKFSRAAIITCGGLCPGMNSVIYHLVSCLQDVYGVQEVIGIQGGFHGLTEDGDTPIMLNEQNINGIQHKGGTILGSSRGGFDQAKITARLRKMGVNMLFVIGGDGTHRAANCLYEQAKKDGDPIAIVGIPKTIDNDIDLIDRSFGFESSIGEAIKAVESAKTEAECAPNGIGIVKLMGRCDTIAR